MKSWPWAHWYNPCTPPEEETPDAPPEVPPLPVPAPLTPREMLKQQGEDWQDALARAVLHPSPENYLEYLRMTSAIQDQAQRFALGFKHMIWQTPEFDYTLTAPVRAEAIAAKNQRALFQETADLDALADRYGLVFFSERRPYCQRFAPILNFAARYGFRFPRSSTQGIAGVPHSQAERLVGSEAQGRRRPDRLPRRSRPESIAPRLLRLHRRLDPREENLVGRTKHAKRQKRCCRFCGTRGQRAERRTGITSLIDVVGDEHRSRGHTMKHPFTICAPAHRDGDGRVWAFSPPGSHGNRTNPLTPAQSLWSQRNPRS